MFGRGTRSKGILFAVIAIFALQTALLGLKGGPPTLLGLPIVSGVLLVLAFDRGKVHGFAGMGIAGKRGAQGIGLACAVTAAATYGLMDEGRPRMLLILGMLIVMSWALGASIRAELTTDRIRQAGPSAVIFACMVAGSLGFWAMLHRAAPMLGTLILGVALVAMVAGLRVPADTHGP